MPSAKQSEKAVPVKLTGNETIEQAIALLTKSYSTQKTLQMLNRGEYDVLYRDSRNEGASERRAFEKKRIDALEKEFVKRGGNLAEIEARLK